MRILLVIIVCSISFITSASANGCKVAITKEKASEIAEAFLKKQKWANKYITPHEKVTMGPECKYGVWFKSVKWKSVKPSRGLITVNMETGEANWVYLK